ncbi:MAG: CBS domain-containing protein [Reichenbachiella sp.]
MIALDLINYTIPPLKPSDKVEKAQDWMNEFHTYELPVVENGEFIGIFNENFLFDQFGKADKIEDFHLVNSHHSVDQNDHYFDILKVAFESKSNIVAVLNEDGKYIGVIALQDLIEAFSQMTSINSPGSIIELQMTITDYSMAEISRIVESEGAKILSSFIESDDHNTEKIKLTIKLNIENSSVIVYTLQRFGYNITSIFGKGEEENFDKERLDTLMHYLKV